MARERIATRMANYATHDDTAVFSLLALCHTPKKASQASKANVANETNEYSEGNGANQTNGTSNTNEDGPSTTAAAPTANNDDEDDGGVRRAAARKGDYTPAVHSWLKKLADKGILQRLATGEPDEPIIEGDEMG